MRIFLWSCEVSMSCNKTMQGYVFLKDMYADSYFPDDLVKKIEGVLRELCIELERRRPSSLEELYVMTHAATNKINELQAEFNERGSDIETGAREAIAEDFSAIARAYGFTEAYTEELIATRDW
ncbi:DUF5713 family protein [Pseudomonas sp. NY15356]|uniref:DUF5713 family protein n=1 Tax=unclassified Pseudomonas TaxID=196821 RepID=UPI003A8AC4E2